MPLPYRTIFNLPVGGNAIQLAEQEVQGWIEERGKVDQELRVGFISGEFFNEGVHRLGEGRELAVARGPVGADGSRTVALRFREKNTSGVWQVDIVALDNVDANDKSDLLLIEATRVDKPDAAGEVDPPAIVKRLLEREAVLDGRTPVTPHPRLIRADEITMVIDAVSDPRRSVSVIVGASIGVESDHTFLKTVESLTARVLGASAVFVLTTDAMVAFNDSVPASHALQPGRVRTFLPRVDINDPADGRRHRVLGPTRFAQAIDGSTMKVRPYLQAAFAVETRRPMLGLPLPGSIRRHRLALDEKLSTLLRTASVEQRVEETRAVRLEVDAAKPSVPSRKTSVDSSLLNRLLLTLRRWLASPEAEPSEEWLDRLDDKLQRNELAAEALETDLRRSAQQLAELQDLHSGVVEDFDFRALELAEAEKETGRLGREVQRLRLELSKANLGAEAYAEEAAAEWEVPEDLSELALRLLPDSGHPVTEFVQFTGDLASVEEVQQRDQGGLYVQRCWDFARVLHDFAKRKVARTFIGNVHTYLMNDDHDGMRVGAKNHAASESRTTIDQWGKARIFPVPPEVEPSERSQMLAHFKVSQENTFAPRMHYLDDTDHTGKIYVGYIGRHLPNTKSKSA